VPQCPDLNRAEFEPPALTSDQNMHACGDRSAQNLPTTTARTFDVGTGTSTPDGMASGCQPGR
jgi:hypothetical protein